MPVIRSETEFDVNVVDSEQSGPAGLSYRSYYLPSDYAAPIAPDIRKVDSDMDSYLQDISRDRYKLIEKTGECGRSGAARIGNHYEEVGGNLETVLDDTFVHTIPNFNLKQSADQSDMALTAGEYKWTWTAFHGAVDTKNTLKQQARDDKLTHTFRRLDAQAHPRSTAQVTKANFELLTHRRNFKSTLDLSTQLKRGCEKGAVQISDLVTEEKMMDWLPPSGWENISDENFKEKAEGRPPLRTTEGEPVKMIFVAEKRKKREEDEEMLQRLLHPSYSDPRRETTAKFKGQFRKQDAIEVLEDILKSDDDFVEISEALSPRSLKKQGSERGVGEVSSPRSIKRHTSDRSMKRHTSERSVHTKSKASPVPPGAQTARLPGRGDKDNIRFLAWVDNWLHTAHRKLIAMQAGVKDRSEKLHYTPDERLAMALGEVDKFKYDRELEVDENTKLKILIGSARGRKKMMRRVHRVGLAAGREGKRAVEEVINATRTSYDNMRVKRERLGPAMEPDGVLMTRASDVAVANLHNKVRQVKKICQETRRAQCPLWGRIDQTLRRLESHGVEEPEDDNELEAREQARQVDERRILTLSHMDRMWYLREKQQKTERDKEAARTLQRYLTLVVDQSDHGTVSNDTFFRIVQKVFAEYDCRQSDWIHELIDAALSETGIPLDEYEAWCGAHGIAPSWRVARVLDEARLQSLVDEHRKAEEEANAAMRREQQEVGQEGALSDDTEAAARGGGRRGSHLRRTSSLTRRSSKLSKNGARKVSTLSNRSGDASSPEGGRRTSILTKQSSQRGSTILTATVQEDPIHTVAGQAKLQAIQPALIEEEDNEKLISDPPIPSNLPMRNIVDDSIELIAECVKPSPPPLPRPSRKSRTRGPPRPYPGLKHAASGARTSRQLSRRLSTSSGPGRQGPSKDIAATTRVQSHAAAVHVPL